MSLKIKKSEILKGTLWSFLQQFSGKVIGFLVQIILARLLVPEDFGLIAMVVVFIGIGTSIMDSGFTQSLIRTKNPTQTDFSSVFFVNITSAILIYFIIFIIAPLVSDFYNQPTLTSILRILSLIIVIKSLGLVQQTIMTIELNFRDQTFINIIATIISGSVAVSLAYMDYGVWALVIMQIISNLIISVLYWLYSKWRPSFVFDLKCLKEHFSFGYKLMLFSFVNSVFNNLFDIIIGKVYPSSVLGFYNRASTYQKFPTMLLSKSINAVTYPMFSKVSDSELRMKSMLKRINKMVVFVYTPFMFFLIFNAEDIIMIVLGVKWLSVVWIFQLLCIGALLQPMQFYNINIVKSLGDSSSVLKINFYSRLLTLIGVLIVLKYVTFKGLIVFQLISMYFISFSFIWLSGSFINYSLFSQIKDVLLELFSSFFVSLICFYFCYCLELSGFTSLLIYSVLFLIIYIFVSTILKFESFRDIRMVLKNKFH